MTVTIGVDPHKGSHTAVAINDGEVELATLRVRATRRQVDQLLAWAAPFETRLRPKSARCRTSSRSSRQRPARHAARAGGALIR